MKVRVLPWIAPKAPWLRVLGLKLRIAILQQELAANDLVRQRAHEELQEAADERCKAQRDFNETMEFVVGRESSLRIKLMTLKGELKCIQPKH